MIFTRVAIFLLASFVTIFAACSGNAQLADQPDAICAAANGSAESRSLWQPDSPGFGYACLPSTVSVGPRGGRYDTYTRLSTRVVGRSHTRVDRIELSVELANPATAQAGLDALSARVDRFFSAMRVPVPPGLSVAIRNHQEIAFDTSFGPGSVFIRDGSVRSVVVQIVRRGWQPDPGV